MVPGNRKAEICMGNVEQRMATGRWEPRSEESRAESCCSRSAPGTLLTATLLCSHTAADRELCAAEGWQSVANTLNKATNS